MVTKLVREFARRTRNKATLGRGGYPDLTLLALAEVIEEWLAEDE
jgi:hypothetical protein